MASYGIKDTQSFQKLLPVGEIDKIYEALGNDDISEVVITTMNALKKGGELEFQEIYKSEKESELYRNEGNKFYSAKRFRPALEYYNQALLYAPKKSKAMILAYSNRSALLFTVKAYTACFNDIETVFSMGCTEKKLVQRLTQRKMECLHHAWMENVLENLIIEDETEKTFFKFDVKRHPQIPCASKDVDVMIESGLPKILAAKNISVGTIVAIEKPFVSTLHEDNNNISCHYCHKFSLNLIPCDECSFALFCDEECKKNCIKEYHDIECKIIHRLNSGPQTKLGLIAALKIRKMCKSWKELVEASNNIGQDRMKTSSVRDIYDEKSKFSLLSYNNTKLFVHGKLFSLSFIFGIILNDLAYLPAFFPKEADERDAAMKAFAKIMMHLQTSYRNIEIINAAKDMPSESFTTNTDNNYGWFSFAGKLKHSCNANLLIVGLKNNIALMAVRPIIKGEELTISFIGHYFECIPASRALSLFRETQIICECRVCVEKWSSMNLREIDFTADKITAIKHLCYAIINKEYRLCYREGKSLFEITCEALKELEGAVCTAEHLDFFRQFRKQITFYQFLATNNTFVQKQGDDDLILQYNKLTLRK